MVNSATSATITAAYADVTRTATLSVIPPVLAGLTLNPTTVRGGGSAQGTVTLSGPAPSGGIIVSLSDNSSNAAVPANVAIPEFQTSATFVITTTRVTTTKSVTISAVYGAVTKKAVLKITR